MTKIENEKWESSIQLPVDYDKLNSKQRRAIREKYIEIQKGKCKHCGAPLDGPPTLVTQKLWINISLFPKNFFDYPVHLDHDHNTGLTRGAVHAKCNAVLWQYYGE